MKDSRIEKLADVLVRYSVAIRKGDLVLLQGSSIAEPLIVALYEAVLRAGGHPQVKMSPDALAELMLKYGSDEQLDYLSPLAVYEIEKIDVRIKMWGEENTKALTNTDAGRHGRLSAASKPIFKRFLERSAKEELRWVGTQYPTHSSAQDAGMSLREYEEFVFKAGLLDRDDPVAAWQEISGKQQQAVDLLNGGKKLELEAANGTHLRMSLENRTWVNCSGKLNFPDGEVFTGPVEDSVEGVICFSYPAVHLGHECEGVRLRFEKGKVVEAHAEKGEEFLISMLDQDAGARFVGEFAIGCNYSIQQYTKNTLFDEKIGGTVHLAVGAGYPETGNTNESGLHWDMVCNLREGGCIKLDGKTVYENGFFCDVDLC